MQKDELNELDKKWDELKNKKEGIFAGYASNNKVIRQLIDLALLQNNMLKGEALNMITSVEIPCCSHTSCLSLGSHAKNSG